VAEPTRTQRLGAYAVAFHDDRMLLTRISAVGYPPGTWTLPGGGVDHGESPHDAVRRELHEETGLEALTARLVDVHDVHVVDVGRDDMYEDYHGVHLLYAVTVDTRAEPYVVDVGGTTDLARWVPVADINPATMPLLPMVTHALARRAWFAQPGTGYSAG
jgi:8-oxo-dGTP diphosphatase